MYYDEWYEYVATQITNIERKYEMTDNRRALIKWRNVRGLHTSNYMSFVANVIEELLEPLYNYNTKDLKFKQAEIMTLMPDVEFISEEAKIDAITDIRVFAENETEMMGYDSDKTLAEVIKEISSRKQCPEQEERWDTGLKVEGEKWQKDRRQSLIDLYTADFSKCKKN